MLGAGSQYLQLFLRIADANSMQCHLDSALRNPVPNRTASSAPFNALLPTLVRCLIQEHL